MKKNNKFVSIIIANYNGEEYITTCLSSVLKTKYLNFEVIVVDDGSTDKSKQIIKGFTKKTSKIKFIQNSKNMGLSRSRNNGITKARGEVLVFLDNDTEVTPTWIQDIVKTLYSDDSIGGVQSKLIEFDERNYIQIAGTKLIPHTGWSVPLGKGLKYKSHYNNPIEIVAIGASFAFKREVLERIGSFDPKMVYFNEDIDFSWRVWIGGWKIVLAPKSIVYHWTKSPNMRKNTNSTLERIYYNMCRNSTRSMLKNYQLSSLLYYFPINVAILIARSFIVLIKDKTTASITGTLKSLAWNVLYFRDTLRERSKIQKARRVDDAYLYKIIMEQSSLIQIYNKYFK